MSFRLEAAPTFKAKVTIPLAGGGKSPPVEFEFRHLTRRAFAALNKESAAKPATVGDVEIDADYVMKVVVGWDLSDEFGRDNVVRLLDQYHAAAVAIGETFARELMAMRQGN